MNDEQLIWEAYTNHNDYQYGHCMFFSEELKNRLENLLPRHELKYELILGYRKHEEDPSMNEDVLIHAYINIDNHYYLDSNGINSSDDIDERMNDWYGTEETMLNDYNRKYDSEYDFNCYNETADHIPENLIPDKCNSIYLKKDTEDYLNRHDIRDLIIKLSEKVVADAEKI